MNRKIAIVTGGSRGIGEAIVRKLISDAFFVIFTYKNNVELANSICNSINKDTNLCISYKCDVSKLEEVKSLIKDIQITYGRVDVLINNAGIRDNQLFLLSSESEWWNVILTNLGGVINCVKTILPIMINQKEGIIINITSISGQRGTIGQTAYSASKAAIVGFSKSIGREIARYGININCIAPGLIETGMI